MNFIFQLFQIIAFKRKPSDLSHNIQAAYISFLVYVASTFVYIKTSDLLESPIAFAIMQTVVQAALYYFIISYFKKQARFVQMISAIFGINAILKIVSILLSAAQLQVFAFYFSILAFVLSVFILRETIERKTSVALLLNIGLHFITAVVLLNLFPDFYQNVLEAIEQAKTKQTS